MTLTRLRRWTSPACAVPRLRVLYYAALAALAVVLLAAHRLVVRERQEARLIAVATRVCQVPARLPVVFVHVPPIARVVAKAKTNIRRAVAVPHKEK